MISYRRPPLPNRSGGVHLVFGELGALAMMDHESGTDTDAATRMDRVTTTTAAASPSSRVLPPVLGRLVSGTFWLAAPNPAPGDLCSLEHATDAPGDRPPTSGAAYNFAWGFGFLQFLLEFGISSALQRQISGSWTKGTARGSTGRSPAA